MGSPNPGYWGKLTVIIGREVTGAAFPLLGESVHARPRARRDQLPRRRLRLGAARARHAARRPRVPGRPRQLERHVHQGQRRARRRPRVVRAARPAAVPPEPGVSRIDRAGRAYFLSLRRARCRGRSTVDGAVGSSRRSVNAFGIFISPRRLEDDQHVDDLVRLAARRAATIDARCRSRTAITSPWRAAEVDLRVAGRRCCPCRRSGSRCRVMSARTVTALERRRRSGSMPATPSASRSLLHGRRNRRTHRAAGRATGARQPTACRATAITSGRGAPARGASWRAPAPGAGGSARATGCTCRRSP